MDPMPLNPSLPPDRKSAPLRPRGKRLYAAALLLFLAGTGCLVAVGAAENRMYFRNVAEALVMPRGDLAATRLFGTVKGESIVRFAEGAGIRFQLEDRNDAAKTLWIVYRGATPDTFQAGAEVIVEGGFEATESDFQARTLMTKCPSKYQKENRG
jgi:cytochrome c-type biogenesis protein CcmE